MSDKFRKFLDAFRAGDVEQSTLGTAIEVSANGTTTVPPSEYERLVFKQFADMKRAEQGYFFASYWRLAALSTKREEGHHLYFRAALFGVVLFLLALLLRFSLIFSHVPNATKNR